MRFILAFTMILAGCAFAAQDQWGPDNTFGVDDSGDSSVNEQYGGGAGEDGASLILHNGADYDTTVDTYTVRAYQGDFELVSSAAPNTPVISVDETTRITSFPFGLDITAELGDDVELGTEDTTAGSLTAFGDNASAGGAVILENDGAHHGDTNAWTFQPTDGTFEFLSDLSATPIFEVDPATLALTFNFDVAGVASIMPGGTTEDAIMVYNTVSGDWEEEPTVTINTVTADFTAAKLQTSGEVEGGSLDINGVGDVSGAFTAGGIFTSSTGATMVGTSTFDIASFPAATDYVAWGPSAEYRMMYSGGNLLITDGTNTLWQMEDDVSGTTYLTIPGHTSTYGALLTLGTGNTRRGQIDLHGASASLGGRLRIYNHALADTNTDLWALYSDNVGDFRLHQYTVDKTIFTVDEATSYWDFWQNVLIRDDMSFHWGTDGDFKSVYNTADAEWQMLDASGNEMMTIASTISGNAEVSIPSTLTGTQAVLSLGKDVTNRGVLALYGNNAGIAPALYVYNPEDYNANTDYYLINTAEGDFTIYADGARVMSIDDSTYLATFLYDARVMGGITVDDDADIAGTLTVDTIDDSGAGTISGSTNLDLSGSADFGVDGSAQAMLTVGGYGAEFTYEAESAVGPYIMLNKERSGAAQDDDEAGIIYFNGEDDDTPANTVAFAAIKATAADVSDGVEDGTFAIQTRVDGALAARLSVDAAGDVNIADDLNLGDTDDTNYVTTGGTITPTVSIISDDFTQKPGIAIKNQENSTGGAELCLYKSRQGSIVQDNDSIGHIKFYGWDGDEYVSAAQIVSIIDGTPGDEDMPGRLRFFVTPDGSKTIVEAMSIDNTRKVEMTGDLDVDVDLNVDGDTTIGVADDTSYVFDIGTRPMAVAVIDETGWAQYHLGLKQQSNDTAGALAVHMKSRAGAIVHASDLIGGSYFAGWDGDEYVRAAQIICTVGGTPGDEDMPGTILFGTTPDGGKTPVTAMTIDNAGDVWVLGALTAASYADNSPVFTGEGAVEALCSIRPVPDTEHNGWAEVDHESLPPGLRREIPARRGEPIDPLDPEGPREIIPAQPGRDIGANIQLNSAAIVELVERIEALELRVAELERGQVVTPGRTP